MKLTNTIKQLFIFLLTATLMAACNGSQPVQGNTPIDPNEPGTVEPNSNPYSPQPDDSDLTRGNAFVENSELLIMESYPVQIALHLEGNLPTSCHQLRVVAAPPDAENRIEVEAYSVVDSEQVCVQVLEPFEANIGLGTFQPGHYTVWVNGEAVGEFDS